MADVSVVPGAGIEPARLAAGDFEFGLDDACLGKLGVVYRKLRKLKAITKQ